MTSMNTSSKMPVFQNNQTRSMATFIQENGYWSLMSLTLGYRAGSANCGFWGCVSALIIVASILEKLIVLDGWAAGAGKSVLV